MTNDSIPKTVKILDYKDWKYLKIIRVKCGTKVFANIPYIRNFENNIGIEGDFLDEKIIDVIKEKYPESNVDTVMINNDEEFEVYKKQLLGNTSRVLRIDFMPNILVPDSLFFDENKIYKMKTLLLHMNVLTSDSKIINLIPESFEVLFDVTATNEIEDLFKTYKPLY